MKTTFADFVRNKRIASGLTLREFCRKSGIDASNWSKVERGLLQPPQSREILNDIAVVIKIEEGSEEYKEMFDLAALSSIPEGFIEKEIIEQLPVFFRTIRGDNPTEEEVNALIAKIKSAWTSER
ncbi:MAG: transcriptional regulator [Bacteroidales bacterium]|nr:transcriptional regulator [Bacteroidales bacterium]